MADDLPEDADNEITRIVRRPGPQNVPVQILKPPVSGQQILHQPTPAAAPSAIVPPAPLAPVIGSGAPPVVIDRPRPVMTPPQKSDVAAPARAMPAPIPVPAPSPVPAPLSTRPDVQAPVDVSAIKPATAVAAAPAPAVPEIEPVVGWLVVVKGPGRGAAREIVTGRNGIGSASDQSIRLSFGDPAIALRGHAYIVYDEEAREFVVEDGKQKIVVRLNGKLLTETMPIGHGDELRIGATTLRFVALCGVDFDWNEKRPDTAADESVEEAVQSQE